MSAAEVIEQIKGLPAKERAQVAQFIAETGGLPQCAFLVALEADDLPVIRANRGIITSQLVHEMI